MEEKGEDGGGKERRGGGGRYERGMRGGRGLRVNVYMYIHTW